MTNSKRIHISDDGVARPCHAQSEESCRAGGDRGHFDSVEEANAYTEKTAREENEAFTSLAKHKLTNEETDRYGTVVATGVAYNPIMQRSRVAEQMKEEIEGYLKSINSKASVSVTHEDKSIAIDIDPHLSDSEVYEIVDNRIVPTKETSKLIKEIRDHAGKFDRVVTPKGDEPLSHFGTKITFLNEEEKAFREVRNLWSQIHKVDKQAEDEGWDDERYDEVITPLVREKQKNELEVKAHQERLYLLLNKDEGEEISIDSLHKEALDKVSNRTYSDWWGIAQ